MPFTSPIFWEIIEPKCKTCNKEFYQNLEQDYLDPELVIQCSHYPDYCINHCP